MAEKQDDWSTQWREEGLQQGLQHERELVSRLAARKFGAPVRERLAP